MKSVESSRKITASMKTISASKLKPAEEKKDLVQPFVNSATKFAGTPAKTTQPPKRHLIIPMASDRGLCGAHNGSVSRKVASIIKTLREENANCEIEIVTLGEKVRAGLERDFGSLITLSVGDLDKRNFGFYDFSLLADEIAKRQFDVIHMISNKWVNAMVFDTCVTDLPAKESLLNNPDLPHATDGEEKEIMNDFYPFWLASLIFSSVIENAAVEISARMAAMEGSTKNATELLKELALVRNRKRQQIITNELIEVVSGSEAISQGPVNE